jgi:hypothetical protein
LMLETLPAFTKYSRTVHEYQADAKDGGLSSDSLPT